jgi:integrase/recombinase XerD
MSSPKRQPYQITISKIVLDGEFQAFIRSIPTADTVRARRARLMLWMLINTGVRASELVALRVQDMPRALGGDYIEVHMGKGGKCRNIPVSSNFAEEIAEYINRTRPMTIPKRMRKDSRAGWVFFSNYKKKYTRKYIYDLVIRTARAAGIEKQITPHKFRHRFCTRALNQEGTNIYRVMGWMGHSSIAVTEKYMHLAGMLSGGAGEALDQMPQAFRAKNFKKVTE